MGWGKLFASLIGLGAAEAKQRYDLEQQAHSPEVQKLKSEYQYLYGNVPSGKGYNHVLEFDVVHAQIREHLKEMQPTIEAARALIMALRNEEYGKKYKEMCDADWEKRCELDPDAKLYRPYYCRADTNFRNWTPNLKYSAEIGWFDWLRDKPPLTYTYSEPIELKALWSAREHWLEEKYPYYAKEHYTYQQFILEVARKTAYDNGYLPTCQSIGKSRNIVYSSLYDGRIPCGWNHYIDWMTGIPNQNYRKKIEELDHRR